MADHSLYAGAVIPFISDERLRIFDEMLSKCNSKTSSMKLREQNPGLLRLALCAEVTETIVTLPWPGACTNVDRAQGEMRMAYGDFRFRLGWLCA
jgi:hypothetical protein